VNVGSSMQQPNGLGRAPLSTTSAASRSRTPPQRMASKQRLSAVGAVVGKSSRKNGKNPRKEESPVGTVHKGQGLGKSTIDAGTGQIVLRPEDSEISEDETVCGSSTWHRQSAPIRGKVNKGLCVAGPKAAVLHSKKPKTVSPSSAENPAKCKEILEQSTSHLEGNSHSVGAMWSLARSIQMTSTRHGNELDEALTVLAKKRCIKSHRLVPVLHPLVFCRQQLCTCIKLKHNPWIRCRLEFEDGELEAIEAGLDMLDGNAPSNLKAQRNNVHSHNDWFSRMGNENSPSNSSNDLPASSLVPGPHNVCGEPVSRLNIVRNQDGQAVRSTLLLFCS
jgi:hypothetical protein